MKTVAERQREYEEHVRRESVAAQALKKRMIDYIESIGEIDLREGHEARRRELVKMSRDRVRDGRAALIGTACDHCKTALVDLEPGSYMLGAYKTFLAVCPKCGWNDYLRDFNQEPF